MALLVVVAMDDLRSYEEEYKSEKGPGSSSWTVTVEGIGYVPGEFDIIQKR